MSPSPPPCQSGRGGGALSSELPQRRSGSRSRSRSASKWGSRRERWQAAHPRPEHCCARLRSCLRLLQTDLSALPRPDPPTGPEPAPARPARAPASSRRSRPIPSSAPHPGRQDGRVHEGPVHGQGGRRGRRGENQAGGHGGGGEDQGGRPLRRKQDQRRGGTRSHLSG